MTRLSDANDPQKVIDDLVARIEKLERQNQLTHAAIDGGTGIAVNIAAGIHVEDVGSMIAGEASMSRANGGRFKAGAAEMDAHDGGRLGSGGTWLDSLGRFFRGSGAIEFVNGILSGGGITAEGVVHGRQGVRTPWGSGTALVKDVMEDVDRKAGEAQRAADSAAGAAGRAQSTADQAKSTADQAKSTADQALEAATGESDGQTLKNANLISPKITGLTAGGQDSDWVPMLINKNTGALRAYGAAG